jgi:hypothetical protein
MNGESINELEAAITVNKSVIELADALERLERNPDFIKVVQQGYFTETAVRLVAFKGSQQCIGQVEIDTDKDIVSIGKFRHYLSGIRRNADIAKNTINDCLEMIAELQTQGEDE